MAQPRQVLEDIYPLDGLGDDSLSLYARATCLLALGRENEADHALREASLRHPSAASGPIWQAATIHRRHGDLQTAIALYHKAIKTEPELRDYGLACISRCYHLLEEDQKESSFKSKIRDVIWLQALMDIPKTKTPPVATFYKPPTKPNPTIRQANRYIRKKKLEKAKKLLADFVRLYPNSPHRGEAAYTLARCLERQGKLDEAQQLYLKVQEYQPNSSWGDDGLFRAGWCQYKLGGKSGALEAWNQVLRRGSGDKLDEALYWCGRVSLECGDSGRSFLYYSTCAQSHPYSYFGLKSKLALDSSLWMAADSNSCGLSDFLENLVKKAGRKPGSAERDLAPAANHQLFTAAFRLADLGILDDAASLARRLEGIAGNDPLAQYHLSRTYHLCGMHAKAIYWGQKAIPLVAESHRRSLLDILYPRKYLETINHNVNGSKLDPALVLAVIRQESKFEALARSRAGARGLMQVMPKTGKHLARMSKEKKYESRWLYQPEVSIAYGTRFLNSMVKMFDGSMVKALAAYNAGPGRVREWLKPLSDKEDDDFLLQEIPVAETRKYVKIVMENYYIYKMLMAPL
jgi:soluble lytic murein transglycosylase